MAVHPLWNAYPSVQKDLINVKGVMEKEIKNRNHDITNALALFLENGGKLVRPAYFLLFASFGQVNNESAKYALAASLEILHVATLVHDDVIDDSPIRRSLPSIQAQYGKDIAVYTGDFLFTIYFHLLSHSSEGMQSIKLNAYNMKRILIGELDQMNVRYNSQITLKQYLQHIKGKTAQLFQFSCFEGAYFAKSSKRVQLLAQRIGYNLGMAFQIKDDILDYSATADKMQKPVLDDLKNGYYTLPLILALKKEPSYVTPFLIKQKAITKEELMELHDYIQTSGVIQEAEQLAERFTRRALDNILKLPATAERVILYEITEKLLSRSY